jgi:hypothetical protein
MFIWVNNKVIIYVYLGTECRFLKKPRSWFKQLGPLEDGIFVLFGIFSDEILI